MVRWWRWPTFLLTLVQMNLLLDDVEVLETTGDLSAVDVRGVEHDSRSVGPGDLFCCLPGAVTDGHDHAAEAVARGAVGLLCERSVDAGPAMALARVATGQARPAMARAAAALHGFPARSLLMIGVTGTNGKTTVAHLVAAILEHAGVGTTVLGTLGGVRTTPESNELQRVLAGVRDRQRREGRRQAVSMEVSSHALVQSRVDCITYDVAVFTNLSRDHLDFHGTMEAYWRAKASLFTPDRTVRGVADVDDPWGRRLVDEAAIPVRGVGRRDLAGLRLSVGRTEFTWRDQHVVLPLVGEINARNALLAAEAAVAVGVDPAVVARALGESRPLPGRLELLTEPGTETSRPLVMVDYAHTPAALGAVLGEARTLVASHGGRVLVVFGCGGNRDRGKRPEMGAVASRLSDVAVLTSDNPRDEDPEEIIAEVRAGAAAPGAGHGRLVVEPDRGAAIAWAVHEARPGDVVVVAGKGHETDQEVGGTRVPFDDRAVARQVLRDRRDG